MKNPGQQADLPKSALALLAALATGHTHVRAGRRDAELLIAADLARRDGETLVATDAGRLRLARLAAATGAIDPFRAQHLSLAQRIVATSDGHAAVTMDDSESPLAWLARRKGRSGEPLIEPLQFQAGEKLRRDFTRAQLTPHVTASWDMSIPKGQQGHDGGTLTDVVVAAREQLRRALDVVGPEFAGLLLDVCCFLKGLEDIERERGWPPRSAKVALQLGLNSLVRHYGLEARGRTHVPIRRWEEGGNAAAV